MKFGFFSVVWILFVVPPPLVGSGLWGVFDSFENVYNVGHGSSDVFDYTTVKISPCDGSANSFAIHRYWDNGCQAKVIKFNESGANLAVEVIEDVTDGNYEYCLGNWPFSIDFDYINDQCDIALVVKVRGHGSNCQDILNGHCTDKDESYSWIQKHYTASAPYDELSIQFSATWSSKGRDWGNQNLQSKGVVVCDSTRFYYVCLSDDATEFCLENSEGTNCFSNDPPIQAGTCSSEDGQHFYLGVFYHTDQDVETVTIRKFEVDSTGSEPVKEISLDTGDTVKQSDIAVVEKGWEKEVVFVASTDAGTYGYYFYFARLDSDLNVLKYADIYKADALGPALVYRASDGFLLLNYVQGLYVQQLSLFTLDRFSTTGTGDIFGVVSVDPNPSSAKVYGSFGHNSDFYLRSSALHVTHPMVSEPLPDLHYRVNKSEEFVFHSEYFSHCTTNEDIGGPFYLKQPSDDFSFVQFDPDNNTFTGTAPSSLFPESTCDYCSKSETFYMRAYSDDEVFTEVSFDVYAHQFYVLYRGTPIPTVSYENGKDVNTTINLLDYFYISGAPDFDITTVQVVGLPDTIYLTHNVTERTVRLSGVVPSEVENCRNPYPINVTFSDCCSHYTAQFVFETTKFRPVINFDVVNETTHYLPPQSVPIGTGININVDNTFVEMADGTRTIHYTAKLRDGSPLPSWLEFDPDTRMFSGFAPSTGCYDLDIEIVGLNDCGLDRSVYLKFSVTNEPPAFDESLSNIKDQTLNAGDKGSFAFDAKCFKNEDSSVEGSLRFEYRTKVDGSDVANPTWLSMSYADDILTFDYDVPSICKTYEIEIYGYDTCFRNAPAVSTPFSITITNKAPVLVKAVDDFSVNGGEYFNVSIPPDTFRDPEGFSLAYQALQVVDGDEMEELPSYIKFDSDTLSFSGECNTGKNETIHVCLRATDGCLITSTYFYMHVLYLPSPPPPAATSVTGTVVGILGGSLLISVAIGLGAFGFKMHRKEIRDKMTSMLFRTQEVNESVAKNLARAGQAGNGELRLDDLKSIESRTLSDTEESIVMDDSMN